MLLNTKHQCLHLRHPGKERITLSLCIYQKEINMEDIFKFSQTAVFWMLHALSGIYYCGKYPINRYSRIYCAYNQEEKA